MVIMSADQTECNNIPLGTGSQLKVNQFTDTSLDQNSITTLARVWRVFQVLMIISFQGHGGERGSASQLQSGQAGNLGQWIHSGNNHPSLSLS